MPGMDQNEMQAIIAFAESLLAQSSSQVCAVRNFLGLVENLEKRVETYRMLSKMPDSGQRQQLMAEFENAEQEANREWEAARSQLQDVLARLEIQHEQFEALIGGWRTAP